MDRDENTEQPLDINLAGEHSSGWEVFDVDEENTTIWWVLDMAGGRVPEQDRNALLHEGTKRFMYRLNKEGGCVRCLTCEEFGNVWRHAITSATNNSMQCRFLYHHACVHEEYTADQHCGQCYFCWCEGTVFVIVTQH